MYYFLMAHFSTRLITLVLGILFPYINRVRYLLLTPKVLEVHPHNLVPVNQFFYGKADILTLQKGKW